MKKMKKVLSVLMSAMMGFTLMTTPIQAEQEPAGEEPEVVEQQETEEQEVPEEEIKEAEEAPEVSEEPAEEPEVTEDEEEDQPEETPEIQEETEETEEPEPVENEQEEDEPETVEEAPAEITTVTPEPVTYNGVTVTVSYPSDAFGGRNVTLVVGDAGKTEEEALKELGQEYKAVDISFVDENGAKVQPEEGKLISVALKVEGIEAAGTFDVVHVDDKGVIDNITAETETTREETKKVKVERTKTVTVPAQTKTVTVKDYKTVKEKVPAKYGYRYILKYKKNGKKVKASVANPILKKAKKDKNGKPIVKSSKYYVAKEKYVVKKAYTKTVKKYVGTHKETQVIKEAYTYEVKEDVYEDVTFSDVEATFEAESFSVYAVVAPHEDGPSARMALNFYNGNTLIKTIYVKNGDYNGEEGDDDILKTIVFDPGSGDIPEGFNFLGWTTDQNYTAESVRVNISDIREDVKELALNDSIREGDSVNYYAAIYKLVDVTYLGDKDVALGADAFLRTPNDPESFDYTINMSYSPDITHNFEGWKVREGGGNIEGYTEGKIYENETQIKISGSVIFEVNAPEGRWLIFHENKGTYISPQFVYSDSVTHEPTKPMERKGYEFKGWYADEAFTTPFVFGNPISELTNVYAKWQKNDKAPYMVICWTQNLARDGYEVADSWVNEEGVVDEFIPYTFVENQDEDYVTGVGTHQEKNDNGQFVAVPNGHYTGFCLTEASKNQEITITPEGDAVLNLYFDRIKYNFKFYLYRDAGRNRYDYANNSGSGSSYTTGNSSLVTWWDNQDAHPSITNAYAAQHPIQSETGQDNRKYYYFTISAYYGDDISDIWPRYSDITGANGRNAVSFVMMVGTKLKPQATSSGSGTVKGVISVLNDNILGATNNSNGNYVVIRFPGSNYNWRYHIWLETVEGEEYPAGSTYTYEGKTYYEVDFNTNTPGIDPMEVRSSNTEVESQNEPEYVGFDYIQRMGETNGVWAASSTLTRRDKKGHLYGNYWNTGNNPTLYHLNYLYSRQRFKISYFDGNYVADTSAGETTVQNKAENLLHESEEIPFGASVVKDEYTKYVPEETPEGYVFEGWYLDEGCTVKYPWDKMPIGGIRVYAKWHQKQYRVILHPNALMPDPEDESETPEMIPDPSLDWGSSSQQMNFRVNYKERISAPFGIRKGMEFVGWFTASGEPYNDVMKLTDDNTDPYDKTEPLETMDKWGNVSGPTPEGETGPGYNSDKWIYNEGTFTERERIWVNRKIDLYAKWRSVVEGAEGIGIIYDLDGGEGTVEDHILYKDLAKAFAQSAPATPLEGKHFDHWVLQTWDNVQGKYVDTEIEVFPGDDFEVLKKNAKVVVTEWRSSKDIYAQKIPAGPDDIYSGADEINGPEGYPFISEATYTIQLKAVYIDSENETPTHITWFANGGENEGHISGDKIRNTAHTLTYFNIQINQDIDIPPVDNFTREDYEFVGWARRTEPGGAYDRETNQVDESKYTVVDEPVLWLKLNEDGETFTELDAEGEVVSGHNNVTKVAADEKNPYHTLYAVWKPKYFYLYHSSNKTIERLKVDGPNKGRYDLTERVPSGCLYGGYYSDYWLRGMDDNAIRNADYSETVIDEAGTAYTGEALKGSKWDLTKAGTSANSGKNFKGKANNVYFLKEVPDTYLRPTYMTTYQRYEMYLRDIILFSSTDDKNYNDVGFVINSEYQGKDEWTNKFTVTFGPNYDETVTDGKIDVDVTNASSNKYGFVSTYLLFSLARDKQYKEGTTSYKPYWITPDGVTVTGTILRRLVVKDKADPETQEKDGIIKVIPDLKEITFKDLVTAIKAFVQTTEGSGE